MDNYLDKHITPELTTTATADIARNHPNIADTDIVDQLVQIRTYILICLANQASSDDLFTAKYNLYSKEFANIVRTANENTAKSNNSSLFSIQIARG